MKRRRFLMQKQAVKSARVTVARQVLWITHVHLLPLNWEPAVGAEPAWAPLPRFGDLLQHREAFANLLNTFVSVSPLHRWCLDGIWFIFLFPLLFLLFFFSVLQPPNSRWVCCLHNWILSLHTSESNCQHQSWSLLAPFSVSDTAKPKTTELPCQLSCLAGLLQPYQP